MIRMGMDPGLMVFEGKGEWFDDDKRRPGSDSADLKAFEELQAASVRVTDPDHIDFTVTDELVSDGAWWVDKLRRIDKSTFGRFRVERDTEGGTLTIEADNISDVMLEPGMLDSEEIQWTVTWNGSAAATDSQGVRLAGSPSGGTPDLNPPAPLGAMKYALMRPFAIVPGTQGSDADNRMYLDIARSEAARWLDKANGRVSVILDSDVQSDSQEDFNLYLIGASGHNSVTDRLIPNTPFHVVDESLLFNAEDLGDSKGARFVWPRVGDSAAIPASNLFLTGTDAAMVRAAYQFDLMAPDRCLPHYLIVDEDTPWRGWEGLVDAGYYH
jgi:hypothetical protein